MRCASHFDLFSCIVKAIKIKLIEIANILSINIGDEVYFEAIKKLYYKNDIDMYVGRPEVGIIKQNLDLKQTSLFRVIRTFQSPC